MTPARIASTVDLPIVARGGRVRITQAGKTLFDSWLDASGCTGNFVATASTDTANEPDASTASRWNSSALTAPSASRKASHVAPGSAWLQPARMAEPLPPLRGAAT